MSGGKMLTRLWWKIRDFIEERIYGPAKCPEAVKDALAHKKQGWHLMNEQEYYQFYTGTLPPGTLVSKEECGLDHPKRTGQYDELPSVKDQNEKLRNRLIRFNSLAEAERMGRITDAERIELDSMSSSPPIMAPWMGRTMFGARRADFPG